MSFKHILVGGGSGFIGTRLTKLLLSKGYDVTIISRMPGHNRITWHELESKGLQDNTIGVINLAGQNVLDPTRRWTAGFKQNVWNSRINTTATLAKAIGRADKKPKVFVSVSGVSCYKPNEKVYTENDVCPPYDFMSKLCHEWEAATALPENGPTRTIKLRSGVVIGREGGMVQSLMLPFWLGLGGPIGNGTHPLPWIHITDLCDLILFCIETDTVSNALNGVAPDIITNMEFTKAFAKALRRPAIIPLPLRVLEMIFNIERSVLLTNGAKVAPEKALQNGFKYKYPKILDACKEVCGRTK